MQGEVEYDDEQVLYSVDVGMIDEPQYKHDHRLSRWLVASCLGLLTSKVKKTEKRYAG